MHNSALVAQFSDVIFFSGILSTRCIFLARSQACRTSILMSFCKNTAQDSWHHFKHMLKKSKFSKFTNFPKISKIWFGQRKNEKIECTGIINTFSRQVARDSSRFPQRQVRKTVHNYNKICFERSKIEKFPNFAEFFWILFTANFDDRIFKFGIQKFF